MNLRQTVTATLLTSCLAAIGILTAHHYNPQPTTTATPNNPQPTTTARTNTPTPNNPTHQPSNPASTPTSPTQHDKWTNQQLTQFANNFAQLLARPDPNTTPQQWREGLAVWIDPDTAQLLSQISPNLIPYTHTTGQPTITGNNPWLAEIPTDTENLTLTICVDYTDKPALIICGVDLGGRA